MTKMLKLKIPQEKLEQINDYLKGQCTSQAYLIELIFKGIEQEKKQKTDWESKKMVRHASANGLLSING